MQNAHQFLDEFDLDLATAIHQTEFCDNLQMPDGSEVSHWNPSGFTLMIGLLIDLFFSYSDLNEAAKLEMGKVKSEVAASDTFFAGMSFFGDITT